MATGATVAAHAQDTLGTSVCSGILEYAARDYSAEDRDLLGAQDIYREHCSGSSSRSNTATGVGLEAVVKKIPVSFSFSGSSNKEKLNSFCEIASDRNLLSERSSRAESTVVREALTSFNECVRNASEGIYYVPHLQRTQLVVEVRRDAIGAELVGVQSAPEGVLTCKIPDGRRTVLATMNTRVKLDKQSLPITCERSSETLPDGTVRFPYANLIINTDRGSFKLTVPPDAILPRQWASDIETELATTRQRYADDVAAFEARIRDLERTRISTLRQDGCYWLDSASRGAGTAQCRADHYVVGLKNTPGVNNSIDMLFCCPVGR